MDLEPLKGNLILVMVQTGLGFALLVVVVVISWRKRNGNGNGHAKPSSEPGVQYFQLATLITDLHDLSRDLAEMERRIEGKAEERHSEVTACLDSWRVEQIKALDAMRREKGAA